MPAKYYETTYLMVLLLFTLYLTIQYNGYNIKRIKSRTEESFLPAFLLYVLITLFIGLRPASSVFVDMMTYKMQFEQFASMDDYQPHEDVLFRYFQYFSSKIMSSSQWFTIVASLYFGLMLWACRRLFPKDTMLSFIVCLSAFSCFAYGTNGLRNGIATSIALLALTYNNRKFLALVLLLIASYIHSSMYLVLCVASISYFYKSTKVYLVFWVVSIFLSLLFSSFFQSFFAGFIEGRRATYLTLESDVYGGKGGFRLDFLLYSAMPILTGYYFVIKKKFNDEKYKWILNTYILANTFWLLVMKASFSNRFAYLSWFLYAVVLIYPFLKAYKINAQYQKMSIVALLHLGFTLAMHFIHY